MFTRLRRRAVVRRPFPPAWLAVLERDVPFYPALDPERQAVLRARVQVFLAEKTFVGCGGLRVTDRMRVVIAAQACRLELDREPTHFPHNRSIFLYPGAFVSTVSRALPGGVVAEERVVRIGESWARGSVVLAWDAVEETTRGEGRNVVLHEFAHQLDAWDGHTDGVPRLDRRDDRARWGRVMRRAYATLHAALAVGFAPIDPYAAQNPAEFFAVATELHFEAPHVLRAFDPDLQRVLAAYYGTAPEAGGLNAPLTDPA